jgi:hypothetical protein
MKSLFHASIGRLTLGIILLFAVGSANAQSGAPQASAQTNAPGQDAQTDHAVVRFLGPQDGMLVFNVSYNNPKGTRFVVAIKDQDGNQLYQDVFKDKSFYKQFKLPRVDKDRIVFEFSNGREAPVVKTFAVNINSRLVQEVAIKKL